MHDVGAGHCTASRSETLAKSPGGTMRRFPLPWTRHNNEDAYWVEDRDGKQFAYCYYREDHAGITSQAYLQKDEARRLATKIAGLPGLMGAFEVKEQDDKP